MTDLMESFIASTAIRREWLTAQEEISEETADSAEDKETDTNLFLNIKNPGLSRVFKFLAFFQRHPPDSVFVLSRECAPGEFP